MDLVYDQAAYKSNQLINLQLVFNDFFKAQESKESGGNNYPACSKCCSQESPPSLQLADSPQTFALSFSAYMRDSFIRLQIPELLEISNDGLKVLYELSCYVYYKNNAANDLRSGHFAAIKKYKDEYITYDDQQNTTRNVKISSFSTTSQNIRPCLFVYNKKNGKT